jgi:hypothetical protein
MGQENFWSYEFQSNSFSNKVEPSQLDCGDLKPRPSLDCIVFDFN